MSRPGRLELTRFQLLTTAASRYASPADVDWTGALEASAPGTVAGALAALGRLDLDAPPALDASDHWYRTSLPELPEPGALVLGFDGLATLVDVWLDGAPLLRSENMFLHHELDVSGRARAGGELVLCFRALTPYLAQRRPRPRWRTRLVESQQLRWVRTSLLGRTPGFCPRVPAVGPYRPVWLEARPRFHVRAARLWTELVDGRGRVHVALTLEAVADEPAPDSAELIVEGPAGAGRARVRGVRTGAQVRFSGSLELGKVARWWPHTHGAQPRSQARLALEGGSELGLGTVAFRTLAVDRGADGRGFGLRVNDVPVFARGACWTTGDLLTLSPARVRESLAWAVEAGMNMLRIAGTNAYESDAFYELCDELGIFVFQEFMLANMDYPVQDAAFAASLEREARELLGRIGARPCLAVLCGGSEVAQQVAMLGLPRELTESALFDELLPRICHELAPAVPYVPASPVGGELPFQVDEGIAHYYGVGAYLRPLEDARRAGVRFAAECLAFANVPCADMIETVLGDLETPPHHPRWKQRVPRDRGAGWDFDDVRDHYVRTLFGVEPRELRYADPERYLALGRAAVGEVMTATFHEWRRSGSSCRGALVLAFQDYAPGAGWGVLDANAQPKSAYFFLKRCLQPVALGLTDEGLNGLVLHLTNDTAQPLEAELEVVLYQAGELEIGAARRPLLLAPRSTAPLRVEALLGRFVDVAYAYRFGPPAHDLTVAKLSVGERVVARAFHLPLGHARPVERTLGLGARYETRDGKPGLLVTTQRFAQCVSLELRGHTPRDDFFHLEPGGEHWVELRAREPGAAVRGTIGALNVSSRTPIAAQSGGAA